MTTLYSVELMTVYEMRLMCKTMKLKRYSQLRKKDLKQFLKDHIDAQQREKQMEQLETDNNIKNINISDLGLFKLKNDDHVFVASVLGQFMDHKKGNRKQSKWSNELLLRIKEEKRNKL